MRPADSLIVVTDKPAFFVGGGRAESAPRKGYEVAVIEIRLDGKGAGTGSMAAAARVRPDGDGGVLLDDYVGGADHHHRRHAKAVMKRRWLATLPATIVAVGVVSAAQDFKSVWRSQDAPQVSFAGKKVAALVISKDDSLRISGEESLVRELTARGLQAVATYRIAPKEELQSADRARQWFEKANVEGVVALRPVSNEKRISYNDSLWLSPSYNTFWGYYGYGYSTAVVIGGVDRDTVITVETLIFSVPRNQLMWAAVSETRNPKTLQKFVEDLVKESVKELQKQGLARK